MKNWHTAIDLFLQTWQKKDNFEGALLTGSYATNSQTESSDIDVMIVLSNTSKEWERGNIIIDGFMIEYIADPSSMWKNSFKEEFDTKIKVGICMFATGKILVDKNGKVSELKREAEKFMNKPFDPMNKRSIEMAKYHIHDGLNKLQNMSEKDFKVYSPQYYLQLSKIINYYAQLLRISLPATAKLYKFLHDENYRNINKLNGFKDKVFVTLVNNCLVHYSSIDDIEKLSLYVIDKMGGFDIDGWVLKTKISN